MIIDLLTLLRCGVQPTQARALAEPMARACDRFGINTPARIAAFIGQLRVESAEFTTLEENLRYTTTRRMVQVWPSVFRSEAEAAPYLREPQKLANRVYAGRLGNGDETSGDGWAYRGRAWKQITGRRNYALAGEGLGQPYEAEPGLLVQPSHAATVSAWFWSDAGCNALADSWQIDLITRRINGPARLRAVDRRSFSDDALRELMRA